MALINCPECGQSVSDKAEVCIHCGYILKEKPLEPVLINVPVLNGFKRTFVVTYEGRQIEGKSGTTVEINLVKPTMITVHLKGYFGRPYLMAKPGDKIQVSISGIGTITLSKVSYLTGNANTNGW